MKRIFLFIPLLFVTAIAFGQTQKIEFEEYDLDNGLHVILHKDTTTPIVAVSVMYHVGSKNEDTTLTGMAHFFEHLMFEGSENIGRGEFSEYVEKAGGRLNANTSSDRTYYFNLLPSNQLELGLWLESERMMHANIDNKGLETQREVVKEEKRQRYDNQPYGTILKEALAHTYQKHPYRWSTIGSLEHLNNAEMDDFMNFYETFYVPNNACLSIAGDIDIDSAKKLISDYFGPIKKGENEISRPDVEEPPLGQEVRDTVYDNINLPAVVQTYRTPALKTEDYYATDMLVRILARGKSSRMYKEVKDQKQKAMQIMSFPLPLESDPALTIAFGIANSGVDAKELEEAMNAEVDRMRNELVSEKELEKARNQVESEFVGQNAKIQGIAQNLATAYTYYGNTDYVNQELKYYQEVTREDIKRVANKYFTKDNRVVLYYLSKEEKVN